MKKLLILFFIFALVFALGQKGCVRKEKEKVGVGTSALMMSFVEGAPPTQLVAGKTYPIYLDISNHGGADIEAGSIRFYLYGFSPEVLQNINFHVVNENKLVKKTEMREGGKERIIFATAAKPAELKAPYTFTMKVDACYNYKGSFDTKICIKGAEAGVCSLEGDKAKNAIQSIGPIQVESLTEQVQGNVLYVKALISNKGIGEVYSPTANCDLIQKNDLNEKLKARMIELSIITEPGFKCILQSIQNPNEVIEDVNGIAYLGTINCYKILEEGEQTREAPFRIEMNYIYRQSVTKDFQILP